MQKSNEMSDKKNEASRRDRERAYTSRRVSAQ